MPVSTDRITPKGPATVDFHMKPNPQLRAALDLRGRSGQVKVLRAVASFELSKGLMVLAAGFGVLLLLHRDTSEIAQNLLRLLHISPDHRLSRLLMRSANRVTDKKLWTFAGVALIYSILRFVEAYGLWKARAWAEWIALVSGALYLPFEVVELIRRLSLFHLSLLIVNLAVVLYMVYLRTQDDDDDGAESHAFPA
jgi:uncharacterized membrane protein (DUF2068 family)